MFLFGLAAFEPLGLILSPFWMEFPLFSKQLKPVLLFAKPFKQPDPRHFELSEDTYVRLASCVVDKEFVPETFDNGKVLHIPIDDKLVNIKRKRPSKKKRLILQKIKQGELLPLNHLARKHTAYTVKKLVNKPPIVPTAQAGKNLRYTMNPATMRPLKRNTVVETAPKMEPEVAEMIEEDLTNIL